MRLGTTFLSLLWQTTLTRSGLASERLRPVNLYIDEAQDLLRLPGDVAELLAQARSLKLSITLAHQHLGQLSPDPGPASYISAPVLFVDMLLMLLGGGVAADAATAPAAPGVLRPGAVPAGYEAFVQQAAQTCPGITAPLLAAQLEAESGWNPNAVSPADAQGLSQFMPGTWIGEGVDGGQLAILGR